MRLIIVALACVGAAYLYADYYEIPMGDLIDMAQKFVAGMVE